MVIDMLYIFLNNKNYNNIHLYTHIYIFICKKMFCLFLLIINGFVNFNSRIKMFKNDRVKVNLYLNIFYLMLYVTYEIINV